MNEDARKKLDGRQLKQRSLYRNWQDVTVEHMKGLVSVVLNMGIFQLTNLKDYWNKDDTCNFPFFRSILECLHIHQNLPVSPCYSCHSIALFPGNVWPGNNATTGTLAVT